MGEHGFLAPDVDLLELAHRTQNYRHDVCLASLVADDGGGGVQESEVGGSQGSSWSTCRSPQLRHTCMLTPAGPADRRSGAEIEGLVRSATSFALDRETDMADLSKPVEEENIRVCRDDFLRALDEVKPSYGAATETLERYRPGGMLDVGPAFADTLAALQTLLDSVERQEDVPLCAALLWGDSGTGKTGTRGPESRA